MEVLVSVIAPMHRTGDGILNLLAALERQTFARDRFEVILVDDCSGDGTPDAAEAAGGARVFRWSHGGPYPARNRGIAEARGRLLAFTDDDCLPGARAGSSEVSPRLPRREPT